MTTAGWIKIHRCLMESEIYTSEPFDRGHAWVDLLLRAELDGTLMLNATELSEAWKWNRTRVYRFIEWLESRGMVTVEKTAPVTQGVTRSVTQGVTRLTLVNYGFYQGQRTPDVTPSVTPSETREWGKGDLERNYTREKEYKEGVNKLTPKKVFDGFKSEFSEVWKLYPKKQGKTNAERDYVKARNEGIERETIVDGLNAYLEYIQKNTIEPQYIKMGSTWFHQRCWEDVYEDTAVGSKAKHPKTTFHNMEERSTSYSGLFKSNYE